jgi:hypothetical protein
MYPAADGGTVLLFKIFLATPNEPVAKKGHYVA